MKAQGEQELKAGSGWCPMNRWKASIGDSVGMNNQAEPMDASGHCRPNLACKWAHQKWSSVRDGITGKRRVGQVRMSGMVAGLTDRVWRVWETVAPPA